MAFWAFDDQFNYPAAAGHDHGDEGWGFDAPEGGNQDWDNWFAGLEAPNDQPQQQRRRHGSTDAHASFHQNRSPSPTHAAYPTWLMGNNTSTPRDSPRTSGTLAASSAHSANPRPFPHAPRLPPAASRPPERNHSNNWLDPTEARRPPRLPYIPDHFVPPPTSDSASSIPSAYEGDSDYDNGIDIDDLLNTDDDDDTSMPPSTRRAQRSVVDLTNDPSSPPPTNNRKRSRDATTQDHTNKRTRHTSDDPTPQHVEELDLTNEAPSAEEELLQAQQVATIAAQQDTSSTTDKPLRVGQRTCIICMEPYTNATVTTCGHIYCHECLTQALIAGEKNSERGVGNCPVCRKPVNRKKDRRQMVPVNFMKKETFKGKRTVRA